ncbi:MAG: SDR family oxidoreductase [Oscillospiraceae bacterium]|nr:SDR family oxidoreductase [Oscillospiraceae bacterium]
MIALVTGASSGIGRDIARSLAKHGINVIITARRRDRLIELKNELVSEYGVKVMCIAADLSKENQVLALYNKVRKYDIDILINNAGYGVFGGFTETDLERELDMLDVNVKAFHILFKLFLRDFKKRDCGYILNTASVAGFMPGPWFSSYYASKGYIVRMTQAVAEELRENHSHVHVSMLCPGPVSTEFSETARVKFLMAGYPSEKLAEHAVREMFAGKLLISENSVTKALVLLSRLVPDRVLAVAAGLIQSKRERS